MMIKGSKGLQQPHYDQGVRPAISHPLIDAGTCLRRCCTHSISHGRTARS
jgi:hypothetical protein